MEVFGRIPDKNMSPTVTEMALHFFDPGSDRHTPTSGRSLELVCRTWIRTNQALSPARLTLTGEFDS